MPEHHRRTTVTPDRRRNRRTAALFAGLVAGMVGLAFASVPLYRIFCEATGFGGTPQRADQAPAQSSTGVMTVRFNSNISYQLPWSFTPVQLQQEVRLGEQAMAYYRVTNRSNLETTGTAVFNVTPSEAGAYFNKVECFCFTEQKLKPGESAELPVAYFIDPALADDPDSKTLTTITLSYTFYPASDPAAKSPVAETN